MEYVEEDVTNEQLMKEQEGEEGTQLDQLMNEHERVQDELKEKAMNKSKENYKKMKRGYKYDTKFDPLFPKELIAIRDENGIIL